MQTLFYFKVNVYEVHPNNSMKEHNIILVFSKYL